MAVKMIEDAERSGKLKPGGTIIEGTSGNTGMGLAMAAVVKGYKCIFTTTDKQSKEKVDALKAFGAEVIVCPTNVDPEDPRSYYSVSSRLERETPNSWKANQYDNLSNSQAHYEQTGPEIWEQTDGRIDHLVSGVGHRRHDLRRRQVSQGAEAERQGRGASTPTARSSRSTRRPGIFDKNEIYPVHHRGHRRGLPAEERRFLAHRRLRKSDRQGRGHHDAADRRAKKASLPAIRPAPRWPACCSSPTTSKPAKPSSSIFHDHGTRYLGKMFNDDWMREKGFLEPDGTDRARSGRDQEGGAARLDRVPRDGRARRARDDRARLLANPGHLRRPHRRVDQRGPALRRDREEPRGQARAGRSHHAAGVPVCRHLDDLESLATMLTPENPAVLVRDFKSDETYIITRSDVIQALS